MSWVTLEQMNSSLNELSEAVYQILHKESFILSNSDIRHIRIGRDDYHYGKSVSGKVLLENIENARR